MNAACKKTVFGPFSVYFRASHCILAILSPGNVNKAPIELHHTAIQNFSTNFDAGPLESRPAFSAKNVEAERLKLAYASSKPVSSVSSWTNKKVG